MDSSDIEALEVMLSKSLTLEDNAPPEEILESITHYFRELRGLCSKGTIYQDTVAESHIIQHSTDIMSKLLVKVESLSSDCVLVCIRVGVQFIGNFIVDNPKNKFIIWQNYKSLIRELLQQSDPKTGNYAAMIFYNVIKDNPTIPIEDIKLFLPAILDVASKESEFGLFCLEHLLSWPGLLPSIYHSLGLGERLFLLEVSREILSRGNPLPSDSVLQLAEEFKKRADAIFITLGGGTRSPEPTESAALLEIVATASGLGDSEAAQKLKQDGSLLTSAVYLLRGVHECFVVEEKLTSLDPLGERMPELRQSPVYGFKAHLVRLIGNLCWQNRTNQDKVRDMEGLPLLLNCSRLDACNPFITQWVILAIRNLCEDNLENQAVIASLRQEGDAPILDGSPLRLRPSDQDATKMNVVQ